MTYYMFPKRTIFVFIIIVLSLLFIGLTALSCLFLFVPQYIESEVIPSIIKDKGIEISSLKIRNIGIRGIEISDIKIGKGQREGLAIDSIRIDYSLSGLLDKQVERIALSGLSLNLEYEKNRISIGGLNEFLKNEDNSTKNESDSSTPVTVKNLLISNSVIHLKVNEKSLSIPFDFAATAFNQYLLPEKFKLGVNSGGHEIAVQGNIDTNKKTKIVLTANDLSLRMFEDIINEIIPLDLKGQADIRLSADISTEPFSISDVIASCRMDKTIINYSGITLKNPVAQDGSEQPINLSITSKDMTHWEYKLSSVLSDYASLPIKLQLSGTSDLFEDSQKGKIKAITELIASENTPAIQWDILLDRDNSIGSLNVQANGKLQDGVVNSFTTRFNGITFSALLPEINARAEYNQGHLSGSYIFRLKNMETNIDGMSFSVPMVSIKGNVRQSEGKKGKYISSFSTENMEILFKGLDITANIPDNQIKGIIQYDMEKGFNADGQFMFKKGTISMSDRQLNIKGISGKVPIIWPLNQKHSEGKLSVKKIAYGDYLLGPMNVDLSQRGNDISFKGDILYPLFPDMTINLSGITSFDSQLGKGKIKVDVPSYQPSSDIDLGKLLPELKGYLFNGTFKTDAEINFSKSGIKSGLNLEIGNGRISNSEKNLKLENISCDVKLEDLISTRSPHGQRLKIEKILLGDITANDFIVDFRMDPDSSIFVEQGSFKWCGGNINIQSFRVDTKKDKYNLTLFCDRLKLADILDQLGISGVTGGGTVNGKIPLTISKGKINFEDSFLYSTPGGGGKINITGTDIFTAGLSPDSPEYVQMDIASEALKAFEYTWVKMSLNSEKGELMVQLQFDGKPENKLPFRYDKNINQFMRVEASSQGSNFQGIRLDVNFRVPLDELLNYKSVLDMID